MLELEKLRTVEDYLNHVKEDLKSNISAIRVINKWKMFKDIERVYSVKKPLEPLESPILTLQRYCKTHEIPILSLKDL